MDNENTQLSDINVGKLNFQPMPKRFMVWDKELGDWIAIKDVYDAYGVEYANRTVFDFLDIAQMLKRYSIDNLIFCQSTNLFDKDGNEIFEGSILQEPNDRISVVLYDNDEGMFRTRSGNVLDDMVCGGDHFEVVGHIFSNPELLEER